MVGNINQSINGNSINASFVFLDLLITKAHLITQISLRVLQVNPALPDFVANIKINILPAYGRIRGDFLRSSFSRFRHYE